MEEVCREERGGAQKVFLSPLHIDMTNHTKIRGAPISAEISRWENADGAIVQSGMSKQTTAKKAPDDYCRTPFCLDCGIGPLFRLFMANIAGLRFGDGAASGLPIAGFFILILTARRPCFQKMDPKRLKSARAAR